MGKLVDITGRRFGRLVVIKRHGSDKYGKPTWLCQCDCGNQKVMLGSLLKSGNSTSCGCKTLEASTKHGMAGTNTYTIWIDMVRRCTNPKIKQYKNYGGRGIKICEEWLNFETFFNDMGDRPEGMSLDRINSDGDYCKENCRWVDNMTQQSNKRNNTYVEFNGERNTLAQWGRILDMDPKLLRSRIFRSKWPIEKAFNKHP